MTDLPTVDMSRGEIRRKTELARARVLTAFDMDDPRDNDLADCVAGAILRYFDLDPSAVTAHSPVIRDGTESLYPWLVELGPTDRHWSWAITCARTLYNMNANKEREESRDGRFTR